MKRKIRKLLFGSVGIALGLLFMSESLLWTDIFNNNFFSEINEIISNRVIFQDIDKPNENSQKNNFSGQAVNNVLENDLDNYLFDIYKITGFKISNTQKEFLRTYIAKNPVYNLDPKTIKLHRDSFNACRRQLIVCWEYSYNQKWPTYKDDITINGNIKRKAGQPYDAHHIIELSWNGPNEWWNLVPAAYPKEHQAGIHRKDGVCSRIFGNIPNYD